MEIESANFTNQCLIAMPAMADPRFAHALTYVIKHDDEGAVGLVVNKPLQLPLSKLLSEISTNLVAPLRNPALPVLFGGPVNTEMGFVLHREKGDWNSTLPISEEICVTSSRDILDAIAQGQGPDDYLVVLGYAGWSAGQLEEEMAANAWLTCPVDNDLLFNLPFEQRWEAGIHKLGIDPVFLASEAGHA
ncbi:MAG: putative transcriptional regulator [Moraxellaceae bacterium]|jgi:putative transcriptional regulator|nr:putative transcriptional regulator [Moraxellaceae bacterium]